MDSFAGAEAVIEAHPVVVVRILPPPQHIHVPRIVGPLIGHPGASLHPDGVAAVQVGVEIRAVGVALVATTQEILVFIEGDLKDQQGREAGGSTSLQEQHWCFHWKGIASKHTAII